MDFVPLLPMRLLLSLPLWVVGASVALAQPPAPTPADVARLRAMSERDPKIQSDGEPWSMDPSSREEARQFFRSLYYVSENVPTGWTGSTASGDAGTTSAAFKEAVRNRVNFYRAYAGVPAQVSMNATFSAKAQQAALMFSANKAISHFPPTSWTFYSDDNADTAKKSNLGIGSFGTTTMDGYMRDHGGGNEVVGHRRWILHPQTMEMGTGDVESQGDFPAAQALWVQDANVFANRPSTRETVVAWPPKGHVPYQLVWSRWSISLPNANFTNATVAMTRNGSSIPAAIEARVNADGSAPEPTLTWLYDGKTGDDLASHDRPSADVDYDVTVSNVLVNGVSQTFTYTVTVFDPDVAGSDFTATAISGPLNPKINQDNTFTVSAPSFANGIEWRELRPAAHSNAFFAEEINSHPEIDGTSDSYSLWITGVAATGNGAFHLAHPEPEPQTFTLPGLYAVPPSGIVTLDFASKLGIASTTQVARAEVSINGGQGWTTVFEQRGTGDNSSPADATYQDRSVDLSAFLGRTLNVRFSYTYGGGSYFPQTDPSVGWLIDDVRLTGGIMAVEPATNSGHLSGSSFTYRPTTEGGKILQARGMFFGHYGMDWGPIKVFIAEPGSSGPSSTSRIVNLSVRANAGDGVNALTVGMVVGGSGTKPLLVRAIGPTLADFGVPGTAPDPAVDIVISGGGTIASNNDWSSNLSSVFNSLGAFALVDSSNTLDLTAAPHSAVVDTQGQNGIVLVEAYDRDDPGTGSARLTNVSARNQVGTGANVLVAGFVIGGNGNKTLLIRGVGASLGNFGLSGVLADPQLVIKANGSETPVASNDNWNNDATIASTSSTLGAFALSSTADAALIVTLAPGAYTATVSGVNETTGIALVEIYEVP